MDIFYTPPQFEQQKSNGIATNIAPYVTNPAEFLKPRENPYYQKNNAV